MKNLFSFITIFFFLFFCSITLNAQDTDGDGISDAIDIDDDNDGVLDVLEQDCSNLELTNLNTLTWHGAASANVSTPDATTLVVNSSAWANAYSDQVFDLPISMEGTVDAAVNGMLGFLPVDAAETAGWNDRGYKMQFNGPNGMYIRHFNYGTGWFTPSLVGNNFKLTIDADGLMRYFNNGNLVFESYVPIKTYKITLARGSFNISNLILKSKPQICINIDSDTDGIPNHLEIDSDDDGCGDSVEAGALSANANDISGFPAGADTNLNGLLDLYEQGTTGVVNYSSTYTFAIDATANACADTDNDGIGDIADIDDDNDGLLDSEEQDCSQVEQTNFNDLTWHGNAANFVATPSANTLNVTSSPWRSTYSDQVFALPITLEGKIDAVTNGMIGLLPVTANESSTWTDGGYKFQISSDINLLPRHPAGHYGWRNSADGTFKITISKEGNLKYFVGGLFIASIAAPVSDYKITITTGAFSLSDLVLEHGAPCVFINTDGDGLPNHLDLDSDGDTCSDAVESGALNAAENNSTTFRQGLDVNENGLLDEFENGTTGEINFSSTISNAVDSSINACEDTDGDGIGDIVDIDDDNDGVLDTLEGACAESIVDVNRMQWHGSAAGNVLISNNEVVVTGNAWATAYSNDTYDLPITIEGNLDAAVNGMIGLLPYTASETTGWNDGGYKIQFNGVNGIYVRNGNSVAGWFTPSLVGGNFKIEIAADGTTNYYHGGTLIYSGNAPVTSYKVSLSRGSFTASNFRITQNGGACVETDTDTDGVPNRKDLDSDNDGCSDAVESGNTTFADNNTSTFRQGVDTNANGLIDTYEDATTGVLNYIPTYEFATDDSLNGCLDTDSDGIFDLVDIDDDNDGVLDIQEGGCSQISYNVSEITWHGAAAANVSVDGNRLNVSGNPWVNAYSDQTYSLPITIEGTFSQISNGMIGILPVSRPETTGWNDGAYKIQFNQNNGMYVRHSAAVSGWIPPSLVGRKFKLEVDREGKIKYYHDNNVVYEGIVPITEYKISIARGFYAVSNFRISQQISGCIEVDSDEDGVVNRLDLDSDNDACSDSIEASNTDRSNNNTSSYNTGADVNSNGLLDIFEDGSSGAINYELTYSFAQTEDLNACIDTDGDGITDVFDIDDDNDGVLDNIERGCGATGTLLIPSSTAQSNRWANTTSLNTINGSGLSGTGLTATHREQWGFGEGLLFNHYVPTNWVDYTFDTPQGVGGIALWASVNHPWGGGDAPLRTFIVRLTYQDGTQSSEGPFTTDDPALPTSVNSQVFNFTQNHFNVTNIRLEISSGWIRQGSSQVYLNSDDVGFPYSYNMTLAEFRAIEACFDNLDADGDGLDNHLDLDADGDGCSDSVEASNTGINDNNTSTFNTGNDTNQNGLLDQFEGATDGQLNYDHTYQYAINDEISLCLDTDNDTIADQIDIDDDNDGVLDTIETNCFDLVPLIPEDLNWHTANGSATQIQVPLATTLNATGPAWSNEYSDQTFDLPLRIEGVISDGNNGMIGILPTSASETVGWNDGAYKFQFNRNNGMYIRHSNVIPNGWQISNLFGKTFVLDIASDGQMSYIVDGEVIYQNSVPITTYKISMSHGNFVMNDLRIYPTADCDDIDTDNDSLVNRLDLDSDGDGCSDSVESSNTAVLENDVNSYKTGADSNKNGLLDEFEQGTLGFLNYDHTYHEAVNLGISKCLDTDLDGVPDIVDIDDDNDGVLDINERGGCFESETGETLAPEEIYRHDFGTDGRTDWRIEQIADHPYDIASAGLWYHRNSSWDLSLETDITTNSADILEFKVSIGKLSGNPSDQIIIYVDNREVLIVPSADILGTSANNPQFVSFQANASNNTTNLRIRFIHDHSEGNNDYILGEVVVNRVGIQFCDTDEDGIYNHLDLDSDGDGCSDSVEASNTLKEDNDISNFNSGTDANQNGLLDEFENGTTGEENYNSTYGEYALDNEKNACTEECESEREALICGDDVVLTAIDNYSNYTWVQDSNSNGVVDPSDQVVNDGDPDGNPATIVVTEVGVYIATAQGPNHSVNDELCVYNYEIVTVNRFGETQNNPIVDWMNARNSDTDTINDVKGELLTCANDGSVTPKIFLCGSNDTKEITLNISDAESIVWYKMNEGSCAVPTDGCPNRSPSCGWTPLAEDNSFVVDAAGEYRVSLQYLNGCVSRFYFSVFQNNLEVQYNVDEIYCEEPGSITITNPAVNYGYRLEDVEAGTTKIAYEANNGPNFDIAESGTYKVYMMPLNGVGEIIEGACEFSTDEITIEAHEIEVEITTANGNCNVGGTIEIEVSNVRANYAYRLYFDEGSGVLGDLVDSQLAHTTNTFSFTNLNPDDYLVVVGTDDNCEVIRPVTVERLEPLSLSATTTSNIGCEDGVVELEPQGGFANPNYKFAVWSKDGTDLYATVASIPATDFVTDPTFLFSSGDEGSYEFIVVDANDCYFISNEVTVEDKGVLTMQAPVVNNAIKCNGNNTGSITLVTANGGTPISYSIDGFITTQSTATFEGLSAGEYTLSAVDAMSCTTELVYVLEEPEALSADIEVTSVVCESDTRVEVRIYDVTGGVAPYEYSFDGLNFDGSAGAESAELVPGDYTIKVKDANDCIYEMEFSLPDAPTLPIISSEIAYNCDGTANVVISNNEAAYDYTYAINGTLNSPSTNSIFTNLGVGNYVMTANYTYDMGISLNGESFDQNCTNSIELPVAIENGKAFEATLVRVDQVSCNGEDDASVTFEVKNIGDAASYEYSVDGGVSYQVATTTEVTTDAIYNAGNHIIRIRKLDDLSCETSLSVTVTEPESIEATATISSPNTCNLGATIFVAATKGTPPYTYQLEETSGVIVAAYQATPSFENVIEGEYVVRIQDANNCELVLENTKGVVISEPSLPAFTVAQTSCYSGANDGEIQVGVTAGTGNGGFQYRIDGGPWLNPDPADESKFTFENLASDTYLIEVKDQYGCLADTQEVTINEFLNADITLAHISSCADGIITINAEGGDTNYQYAVVLKGQDPTGTFNTNNVRTFTAGDEGEYDVFVRDGNGGASFCEYKETVEVKAAVQLNFTATPIMGQCHDDLGSIEVAITSGTGPFEINLVDVDHAGAGNRIEADVLIGSKILTGLEAGEYRITVTDALGCTSPENTVNVIAPEELTADVISILDGTCAPASGVRFENYPTSLAGTVEFSIDGGDTWQTTPTFNIVTSGNTVDPSIRTVDALGNTLCRLDMDRYTVLYPLDDLDITVTVVIKDCNDLEVTVLGKEGDNSSGYRYTYTDDPTNFNPATAVWTPRIADGISHTFANIDPTTPQAPGLPLLVPGRTYVFFVEDSAPCIRQSNQNVSELNDNPIDITETIKPSCNGENNGEISFELSPQNPEPNILWELREVSTNTVIAYSGSGASASIVPYPADDTILVTGISEGDYYLFAQQFDASNGFSCRGASENTYVKELKEITGSFTKADDISCANPGIINATNINGGGGDYTYTLEGPTPFVAISGNLGATIEVPANAPAGDYEITLTDQYGCSGTTETVNMQLSANPTIDDIIIQNCTLPFSVVVNASTTASSLLYSLDNGVSFEDNGGQFNSVAPGTYAVLIKDGNGCEATQNIDVYPSLEVSVQLTKLIDCSVTPDAQIRIEVTNGSGNYEYQIIEGATTIVAQTALVTNPLIFETTQDGDYDIEIFDMATNAPVCSRTFEIQVLENIEPEFNETTNPATCNGSNDGKISLQQTDNGISPLTYTISPNVGNFNSATDTFEDLPAGMYSITATGTNGCTTEKVMIEITEPQAINVTPPTVVPFSCAAGNTTSNASVTVNNVTGGTGVYTRYEFLDDNGTPDMTDDIVLQNGPSSTFNYNQSNGVTLTINVYDENGCSGSVSTIIEPFNVLEGADIVIDEAISCVNAGEDITITARGSVSDSNIVTHDYTFQRIETFETNTTGVFIDLAVGSHNFEVVNTATNCKMVITHTVNAPLEFDLNLVKTKDVTCFNTETGELRLGVANTTYLGGFNWEIYNTNGTIEDATDDVLYKNGALTSSNETINVAMQSGSFRVLIAQQNLPNCSKEEIISINGPEAEITAVVNEIGNVLCANNQGKISIAPSGGKAPYTIAIQSGAFNATIENTNTGIFDELTAGVYQVTITDAFGCVNTDYDIELIAPEPIVASISPNSILSCPEDTNGVLTATVNSGGYGMYQYQLNRYDALGQAIQSKSVWQTSGTFDDLVAGIYSVTISDDGNCGLETEKTIIAKPEVVVATLIKTQDLGCQQDAILELSATGGAAPYQWSLTTSGVYQNFSGGSSHQFTVGQGSYAYYVKDSNNCIAVLSNTVVENPIRDLTLNIDSSGAQVGCNGDASAILFLKADGGLGNYTYELFEDSGLSVSVASPNTDGVFDQLLAGTYYAQVTSLDCVMSSEAIVITEPAPLEVSSEFSDVTCKGNNDGSITVLLAGGAGDYQYAISPNLDKFEDIGTFNDLPPGAYTVFAQDGNGCFEELNFTIAEPDELMVDATSVAETCTGSEDGSISITINGGVAPYSTSLNSDIDSNFEEGKLEYSDLESGSYIIYIKDANGCQKDTFVEVDAGVNLNAIVTPEYNCTGSSPIPSVSVILEDDTIAGDVLYALDGNAAVLDATFENLSPGDHTITIMHAGGCIKSFEFEIESFDPLEISLSQEKLNAITATAQGGNGPYQYSFVDGVVVESNEQFIYKSGTYTVTVTDQNGCTATEEIDMEFIDVEIPNFFTPDGDGQNDTWLPQNLEAYPTITIEAFDRYGRSVYKKRLDDNGWDGVYNNIDLPSGDYWYIIKLNNTEDNREFIGHFTLYR